MKLLKGYSNLKYKEYGIKLSLQILEDQRKRIITDSLSDGYDIYMGLHKSASERVLHFDKYIIMWLDEHWNLYCKSLDEKRNNYLEYQRQEITYNFVKKFSEMLIRVKSFKSFSNAELTLKCLKIKKQCIEEMLDISEKTKKNTEKLLLDSKKHEDWFEKEIAKYTKGE